MKRPTESEIYEQAFEFVLRCNRFRQVVGTPGMFRVNDSYMLGFYPQLPERLCELKFGEGAYWSWGIIHLVPERTLWEWLTRKPSEKLQWIQALDAAAALLR